MTNAVPIPQIFDASKRALRTLVQTGIPTFIAFAGVLPAILTAAHQYVSPNLYLWLLAVAGGITATATVLARIMAIPAVNTFLTQFGLGAHSGNLAASDSWTTLVQTVPTQAASPNDAAN